MRDLKGEAAYSAGASENGGYGLPRFSTSSFCNAWGWHLIPFIVAALVLVPVGTVVLSFFIPADDIWHHLVETTLADLLANTFWLVLGVASGAALLGVSLAWFTAVCEFPGREFL